MAMKMRVAQDNCDSCLQSCEGDNARRSRLSAQFRTASLMVPSLDEGGAVGAATELGCVDIMIARASPAGPERVYPMYPSLPLVLWYIPVYVVVCIQYQVTICDCEKSKDHTVKRHMEGLGIYSCVLVCTSTTFKILLCL